MKNFEDGTKKEKEILYFHIFRFGLQRMGSYCKEANPAWV